MNAILMMKAALLFCAVYFPQCDGAAVTRERDQQPAVVNERPIIGLLAQEDSFLFSDFPEEDYASYIAASYVKAIESSGARVAPIMIGRDRSYYKELLGKLNGVMLPGGATHFNKSNGYADAGQYIYEIAQEMNDAGDYFPLFGTCLGLQLFVILASGRGYPDNSINCHSFTNQPLKFTKDYRTSKMYKDAPQDVIDMLTNEPITVNGHEQCIIDKNLEAFNLTKDWRPTSYSNDDYGVEFIASIEHTRYPFYALQFHPEKVYFEWHSVVYYIGHSVNALRANRHFMDFFAMEARKNMHTFPDEADENKHLIYNYQPQYTDLLGSVFLQCYLFEPRGKVTCQNN